MKKGIIVLLIAVLVAGFAFAADATFTGNAKIGYEVNLDAKNHGIFNDQVMEFSVKFEFSTAEGGSTGEGKLYAEIAAEADFSMELKKKTDGDTATPTLSAEITKANIVAGDLTINILGPEGAYDYAAIYIKDKNGDPVEDMANDYAIDDHGFVATYKDFSVAFSFYRYSESEDAAAATFKLNTPDAPGAAMWVLDTPATPALAYKAIDLYTGVQTPAFAVADGLTVQVGANFRLIKFDDEIPLLEMFNMMRVGGGADVKFAPEDSKLSAYFAADAEYIDLLEWDDGTLIPVDIAAGAKYDFVYADVYFGTENKFEEGTNVLAGRVGADYKVNDAIKVSGKAEAYWKYLTDDSKPVLNFTAGVDYNADPLAAYVKAEITLQNGADGYELKKWTYPDLKGTTKYRGLGISAGVSSTAIIDNATVALDWTKADFSKKNADDVEALGLIQASIKVAF